MYILQLTQGIPLEFIDQPPVQDKLPREYKFNEKDANAISEEVDKLIERNIVTEVTSGWNFVSNVFARPKPNNKIRLIIDLSPLNKSIKKLHFKMDNLQSAVDLMFRGAFLASIDLRDAYFTLPVLPEYKSFLCFQWNSRIYMYNVMPFGLTSAPRFFTVIMKPPMAVLRKKGIKVFNYIDDLFVIAESKEKCERDVSEIIDLLTSLGFFINYEKSSLVPSTSMRFLGFLLDSEEMIVRPPDDKIEKTMKLLWEFSSPGEFVIREVASLVGVLNDLSHGVDYSKAHIKGIETDKNFALKLAGEDGFEGLMTISESGIDDLIWWINNIEGASKDISVSVPSIKITTDASKLGWGAISQGKMVNGMWNETEKLLHINALETLAVSKALQALFPNKVNTHFKLLSDNTTTIAYINKAGGTWSKCCNNIAKFIWEWCQRKNNWITATFIAGSENLEADFASRHFTADTEWGLNPEIFESLCEKWFTPDVDLFGSEFNHLLPTYVSWGPDAGAFACDAFLLNWADFNSVYLFPPFRLVSRCIKKIRWEKPKGFLVAPNWPGQVWFADVVSLSKVPPLIVPRRNKNLIPKSVDNLMSKLHSTTLIIVQF